MACSLPHRSPHRGRAAGFSLVELMVAVLIGIIGSIVIFQVFSVFEGQKRTTTSAGDAQQNGLAALLYMERDARMAGFGINNLALLGCTVNAYDANGARTFSFPLAPVQIAKGASTTTPDTITFTYGNASQRVSSSKLTQASPIGQTFNKIDSSFGHSVGDLIILAQAGQACTMRQITAVPGTLDEVDHVAAGSRYNNSAGPPAYSAWDNTAQSGGVILNLGSTLAGTAQPAVASYSVSSSQLSYWNQIQTGAGAPLVDGIVQLKAQYGLDANGDGIIQSTEWQDGCTTALQLPIGAGSPPACAAPAASDWAKVLAIRMAVVARSVQPEKPDPATGSCTTTTASPTWAGGTLDLNLTAVPDNKCYRYRVFETAVPVRNLIWVPL